jgi:hypothetical protein
VAEQSDTAAAAGQATAPLTQAEWEAIAVLRAAAGVALRHNVLALVPRVEAAIVTVRALMDRTRPVISAGEIDNGR